MVQTLQNLKLRINGPAETHRAQMDDRFDRVAHVFHLEWHGIRSATSCLPGHKIGISADQNIDGDMVRRIIGFIYEQKISKIVYQGFSNNAEVVARALNKNFGKKIDQYVVTHVTSTQFEHYYEIIQQKSILTCLSEKVFHRIGSVKPDFQHVITSYWPATIFNAPPRMIAYQFTVPKNVGTVFVPLENTLRKNLYTNIIGALNSKNVSLVFTVNQPSGLESIVDTNKCKVIGYQRGSQLYDRMAEASLVLNCTLAECQPMTQLEALAVGTPCLTGKLGLVELEDHPFTQLTEVNMIDSPAPITTAIDRIFFEIKNDYECFIKMMNSYVDLRTILALNSIAKFVDV
ncbi:hypothetical protein [Methylobacterium aquaticum]|uniref:hypothetical protein n=1 Tax=Methylobacterium aquaticum TaxID=270351 RepID=UPI0012E166CD|nr:hypothetical protein [Methylobacterium aquaticum]